MSKLSTNLKGHVSTSQVPDKDTSWSEGSPGPFIGIVKGNKDPARMGRLNVFFQIALEVVLYVRESKVWQRNLKKVVLHSMLWH